LAKKKKKKKKEKETQRAKLFIHAETHDLRSYIAYPR